MKIGKKLYVGFGSVLVILVLLLVVNLFAGLRERSARLDASNALESVRTIEAVRYQIMLNRLNLNNYLLSGDPRDEERVNKGLADISEAIKRGQSQASTNTLRTALTQVENTETNWADNFAKALLAKRHQVDSGDATVSDLQIFYLQKDPGSWLVKSSTVLDRTNQEISRSLDETSASAASASTTSTMATIGGTLFALLLGLLVAFYTARSITDPLTHLITVARQIADSGDLDQSIDIQRNDEIGSAGDHLQQYGRVPQRNGRRVHGGRRGRLDRGSRAAIEARHSGQRVPPHVPRTSGPGAHHPRLRCPGFGRFQSGCRCCGRVRQGQRAGLFRN